MKPHLTKHKKGWKCRIGWMQIVMPTAREAYERFWYTYKHFWRRTR